MATSETRIEGETKADRRARIDALYEQGIADVARARERLREKAPKGWTPRAP
jgi:hypothetical protein